MENGILDWCREELDDMPVKVNEYNRAWMRRQFSGDQLREAEKRLSAFVRTEWHDPISHDKAPWKLIDGKAILSRVRRRLQTWKIHLPESAIHEVMEIQDYGESLVAVAHLVAGWAED